MTRHDRYVAAYATAYIAYTTKSTDALDARREVLLSSASRVTARIEVSAELAALQIIHEERVS